MEANQINYVPVKTVAEDGTELVVMVEESKVKKPLKSNLKEDE